MRNQVIVQFIKTMAVKIIMFVIMMTLVTGLMMPIGVIVSNELALTQMQNSNEMYMLMQVFDKVGSVVNIVYAVVVILFVYTLGRDTYKFVKTVNAENEKEN